MVAKLKILEIAGLTKKYGDTVAVEQLNLSVESGAIYGLLGPNGAGKSTTINIICGLIPFDAGDIHIFEKNIKQNDIFIRRNLGVVPQDIAIYEDLTAWENVRFFGRLYGLKGNELKQRVMEALEFVGLTDKAKVMPGKFSGGMKRRLNIACALMHHPQLLIMDEPTVGVDPQSRNHILQSVRQLNKSGCTVIYTSHYIEEVEEICTRVAIMDHGHVIAEGTKEELKAVIANTNTLLVTIDEGAEFPVLELINLDGVLTAEKQENIVTINSSKEKNNLDKIIAYFTARNISIRNIENKACNLETVFLTLTGHQLRD